MGGALQYPVFHGEPELSAHSDGVNWTVMADYHVDDVELGHLVVPRGFVSDLGSIPRIFQNLISPEGRPLRGYLLHDWLYATQMYRRKLADDFLFRAFAVLHGSAWAKWAVYYAVRLGGGSAWRHDFTKERRWREKYAGH